ncbi:MAG TPA: sterol desaturase family protein, partial [Terriglobales bacterium]
IPGFVLLLVAEAVASWRMQRELYEWHDTAASLSMGLGNVALGLVAKAMVFAVFTFLYHHAPVQLGYSWWVWLVAYFAEDFTYYWFHRVSHECRFFWASHVVHHSSQRYNLGTALRQTWTGAFMGPVFWLWMPLAGFPPAMILTLNAVSLLYQFWIHTEFVRSIGPLEWVLNTPSHHRVHHATNPQYIDRNHGGWLIIWDRIFGTFEPEVEPCVYGLTKNIDTFNPVRIAFHEWVDIGRDLRQARGWRARWHYAFGNPGWREDSVQAVEARVSAP